VDVGHVELGRAARADGADDRSFVDSLTACDGERAEVRQRDGETAVGIDRERLAARGHGAGEGHASGRGGAHGRAGVGADRNAAVLAGPVWMRRIERERLEHRPSHGPGPRAGNGRDEEEQEDDQSEQPHAHHHPSLSGLPTERAGHGSRAGGCCQS
jgi:hypothetical protein